MKRRTDCPPAQKRAAVARVAAGETVSWVAQDLKLNERRLYDGWAKYREGGMEALRGRGRRRKAEVVAERSLATGGDELSALRRWNAELERKIGQQQVDLDFFRQALQLVRDRQQASGGRGGRRSTKSSRG